MKKKRLLIIGIVAAILIISFGIFLNRTPMLHSQTQVAKENAPTVIYIFSSSDASTLPISSHISEYMEQYNGEVRFEILDTLEEQDVQTIEEYISKYDAQYAPSIILLSAQGEVILTQSGEIELEEIDKQLKALIELN